jgi:hypothetical protein
MPRGTVALGLARSGSQAGPARVPSQLGLSAHGRNRGGAFTMAGGGGWPNLTVTGGEVVGEQAEETLGMVGK